MGTGLDIGLLLSALGGLICLQTHHGGLGRAESVGLAKQVSARAIAILMKSFFQPYRQSKNDSHHADSWQHLIFCFLIQLKGKQSWSYGELVYSAHHFLLALQYLRSPQLTSVLSLPKVCVKGISHFCYPLSHHTAPPQGEFRSTYTLVELRSGSAFTGVDFAKGVC